MVSLKRQIEAYEADGTLIFKDNKEKILPTLKDILLYTLRICLVDDQKLGFKEKNHRYQLIKRIEPVEVIEFTESEKGYLRDRIGAIYQQPGIVGRASELLDEEMPTETLDAQPVKAAERKVPRDMPADEPPHAPV